MENFNIKSLKLPIGLLKKILDRGIVMGLKRLIAAIIDMLIIICLITVISIIFLGIMNHSFHFQTNFIDSSKFSSIFHALQIILVVVPIIYFFCCDHFFKGSSIGKLKMNLMARNMDMSNINLLIAFFRSILKFISIGIYPAFILVFIDKKNRTFYDFLLKTHVTMKGKENNER